MNKFDYKINTSVFLNIDLMVTMIRYLGFLVKHRLVVSLLITRFLIFRQFTDVNKLYFSHIKADNLLYILMCFCKNKKARVGINVCIFACDCDCGGLEEHYLTGI